jgi:hypothetical protein
MKNRLILGAVLVLCASVLRAGETLYQIDLVPSGKLVAKGAPTLKGSQYLFRSFPDGTFMSLRKSDVKKITPITDQAAAKPAAGLIQIGNLAMQGGSAQAGATNASAVKPSKGPALGRGFYGEVIPGETQAFPNSANDNQVGRTWAAPPSNATQSSPGAPPTMAGDGSSVPTMQQ